MKNYKQFAECASIFGAPVSALNTLCLRPWQAVAGLTGSPSMLSTTCQLTKYTAKNRLEYRLLFTMWTICLLPSLVPILASLLTDMLADIPRPAGEGNTDRVGKMFYVLIVAYGKITFLIRNIGQTNSNYSIVCIVCYHVSSIHLAHLCCCLITQRDRSEGSVYLYRFK